MRYKVYTCNYDWSLVDAVKAGDTPEFETDSAKELYAWLDEHDYLDGDDYWGVLYPGDEI